MDDAADTHIKLDKFWPYQVVVLADQISRHTSSVVRTRAGLNISQWRVLAAVADSPGRTAAEVTTVTPMDKTIVSRAVASLIQDGLIQKTQTEGDKRRMSLTVTPSGLEIYKDIASHLNRMLRDNAHDGEAEADFMEALRVYSARMNEINSNTE